MPRIYSKFLHRSSTTFAWKKLDSSLGVREKMNNPLEYVMHRLKLAGKHCESPRKDRIQALLYELKFVRTYVKCIAEWGEEAGRGSVLPRSRIQELLREAIPDLKLACYSDSGYFVSKLLDGVVSDVKEKVEGFRPQIRKSYGTLVKESWLSNHPMDAYSVRKLIEDVLENLKELVEVKGLNAPVKYQMETVKENLRFLLKFLDFCLSWCPKNLIMREFVGFLQDVATNAASLFYVCWIDEMHEALAEIDIKISDLLIKMKPHSPEVIKMYVAILKASKEQGADYCMEGQVLSLVNFMVSEIKIHQVADIRGELTFLITVLLDIPCECTENWTTMETDIKAVVVEVGSFNYSIYHNETIEEVVREMNLGLSRLLEKMRFIRAEVFLMRMVHREDGLIVPLREKIPILHENLKFFKEFFSNQPEKMEEGKLLLTHAKSVAKEVVSFIYSINENKMAEEMVTRTNLALSVLHLKTELIKAEIILMEVKNVKAGVPAVEARISCVCIFSALARWSSRFCHLRGASYGSGECLILDENQIEALLEGLRFLRKSIMDSRAIEVNSEDEKLFLTHLMDVARESSSLIFSCSANDIAEDVLNELKIMLVKLLQNIDLTKAELFLMDSGNHELGLKFHMKDEFQNLYEGLKFLRMFLMDQPKDKKKNGKLIFTQSEAVAKETACLICPLYDNVMNEERAKEIKLLLPDLLEKIKLVKVEIKKIFLQPPQSSQLSIPKTDDLGFLNFLLGNLRELLNRKVDSIASKEQHIKIILEDLEFLKSFLNDVAEHRNEHDDLRNIWTDIVHISYETEYVIDSFMLRDKPLWYRVLWLSDVMEEIKLIKRKVMDICEKKNHGTKVHRIAKTSSYVAIQVKNPAKDEVVIGVRDEAEKIIDQLRRGKEMLDVVSIVGMAGLGKTTLARKVYNDPSITYHFHVRAWCCVSQIYQKRDLFLDILSDVIELTDEIPKMCDEDVALKLYRCLKGQKYLIVLDDLWDIKAWDELKWSFPNDNNGSRILFTSQLHDVALKAKAGSYHHPLRLLRDDESWELLQEKLFQKEGCPSALVEVGKRIAKNCKGLPLAVVVVAGLLAKKEVNLDSWKEVEECSTSPVVMDPQRKFTDILELSYRHLPDHLKSCFLYFGAFPVDKEIRVRKLQWLWVAEGLLSNIESKSLEDAAENCLSDLINRSLVFVAKRSSNGGVKSCHLHDLLRDFCLEKAKEENFIQRIDGYGKFFPSSPADLDCVVDEPVIYQQRRLCIYSERKHFTSLKPRGPYAHSLLFLSSGDKNPGLICDISFISQNFKLLSVLNLESINMGDSFPSGIELMVLLRYLSVRGNITSIPSSIGNLWNLEVLLVKGLKGEVTIPDAFWSMKSLRHVHINHRARFLLLENELDNSFPLEDMETFSSPALDGKNAEIMLRRLPRLRKLRCICLESWDSFRKALDFPTRLQSLKIFYHGRISHPRVFNFPENLKKLTLSKFRLHWDEISTIGRLRNLEVLKLLFKAVEGPRWDMREEEFLKLKFLKLEGLDIMQWNASEDSFPCLQWLVLHKCKKLEEIPSSFGLVPTLQMIEVQWCSSSAVGSVRQIQEDQLEVGNNDLKVEILPSELVNKSSS